MPPRNSCEIEDKIIRLKLNRLCLLCVMLRSRVLGVLYGLMQRVQQSVYGEEDIWLRSSGIRGVGVPIFWRYWKQFSEVAGVACHQRGFFSGPHSRYLKLMLIVLTVLTRVHIWIPSSLPFDTTEQRWIVGICVLILGVRRWRGSASINIHTPTRQMETCNFYWWWVRDH